MHHRALFVLAVVAAATSACTVDTEEAAPPEESVGSTESAFPILPICFGPTALTSIGGSPGGFREQVDLFGPGDRSDFAWVEHRLSAPSSLYSQVSVTSTVNVTEARIELNMMPFGYVAGGVNLLLEVTDGTRVLCSSTVKLVERSTIAGEMNDGAAAGPRTLTCSFSSTGLTRAPIARTSLETWASVAGAGTAYIRGSGSSVRVEERKCMSLLFTP